MQYPIQFYSTKLMINNILIHVIIIGNVFSVLVGCLVNQNPDQRGNQRINVIAF